MTVVAPLVSNFTAGELSPLIDARVDLGFYGNGCRRLENAVALPYGPVTRRPGTRFVAELKDSGKKGRLIGFQFSVEDAYVLQCEEGAIRFLRDGGQIVAAATDAVILNGDFATGLSNWSDLSTGGGALTHDAVNGRMNLVAGGGTAIAEQAIATSQTGQEHVLSLQVEGLAGDSVTVRIGTASGGAQILAERTLPVGAHVVAFTPTASPFFLQVRSTASRTLQVDDVALIGSAAPGPVPVELAAPWTEADLPELRRAQSRNWLWLVHAKHPIRTLKRFGHTTWSLERMLLRDGPFLDENATDTTLTASARSGAISITASVTDGINDGAGFSAGDIGRSIRLFNGWAMIVGITSATEVAAEVIDPLMPSYTAATISFSHFTNAPDEIRDTGRNFIKEGFEAGMTVAVSGTASNDGSYLIETVSADRLLLSEVDAVANEAAGSAFTVAGEIDATTAWRLGLYAGADWPSAVTLHEKRLWLGNLSGRFDASVSDAFDLFSPGSDDDLAIARELDGDQVNSIFWFASGDVLFCGTLGAERRIRPAGVDKALTPANIDAKAATQYGCAPVSALQVTSNVVLFLERQSRKLRELVYDIAKEGFRAPDLTVRAEHITLGGLSDLAWMSAPWPIVWCARADGVLLGMTYERDQQVVAWHRHPLGGDGAAEAVATIPGSGQDELWLIVRRTIGGQVRRYVERLDPFPEETTAQADLFYVDGGLSYSGAATTVLSGLDHLEDETVQILTDGAVHPERTVVGGQVQLDYPAAVVHAGLGYRTVLLPMKPEAGAQLGTAQGRKKLIREVTVRLHRSLGMKIGRDEDHLDIVPFGFVDMDKAPDLFTGDRRVGFPGSYETAGDVMVVQDLPLPLTVVSLSYDLQTMEG